MRAGDTMIFVVLRAFGKTLDKVASTRRFLFARYTEGGGNNAG